MRTHSFRALAFTASTIACAAAHGQCDAQWFTNVGKPGLDGPVWASTVWDDGAGEALYVGGEFWKSGDSFLQRLGKWDGKGWSEVHGFNFGFVYAMQVFNSNLYVGGDVFVNKDGQSYPLAVLQYGAQAWTGDGYNAPPGIPDRVFALERFAHEGDRLIVGGEFGLYPLGIGQVPLGPGTAPKSVLAMTSYPGLLPQLFVGGYGDTNISVFDRLSGFRPLSSGTNGPVNALCIFDDGSGPALFAGGDFTDAGGVAVHSIAKWDGESWSDVGGGIKGGLLAGVYSLAVFDDGNGEALFVGGNFDSAGGQPASNVARWDGANWSALGDGVTGDGATVLTMTPFKTGNKEFLYVGGWFDQAGGLPSNNIARWGCPQEKACYPDCDGTNSLDLFDFLCFVNQFNAGVPYSDCTQDGVYDLFDFLCFVNAFNAGCP